MAYFFDGAVIMQNLTQNLNIKYHVGVEISARIFELKINVHLLCYDFDTKNKEVSKIIEDLKLKRLKKLDLMIDFVEKKYADLLQQFYAQIDKNVIENQRLVELRDSLLPKLMSGELDVSDLDI